MTHVSVGITTFFQRMEGLTVEVDEDLCTGCEECMEVCIFKGMEMIDEKARINQKRCLGCGRCESICPSGAISIATTDPSYINKIIKKLEAHVDVS